MPTTPMVETLIPESVREDVLHRMSAIEREEDVRIFLAVESGSRAWGFASRDSDYDVRFLYLHRRDWYLSVDLEAKRDVIERPIVDEIDLSGWDIRKALKLLRKSNPPLLEWLQSPLVYAQDARLADGMRALLPAFFSPRASLHHYLHMARGNFREYLKRDRVRRKKYFYVLRPLFGVLWIESDFGPVPIEFERLLDRLVPEGPLRQAIDDLVVAKRNGDELDDAPPIPEISDFIERELERLERDTPVVPVVKSDIDALNVYFRHALDTVWSQEHP